MKKSILYFLAIGLFFILSCRKDTIDNNITDSGLDSPIWGNGISTKVYGTVTDTNGMPISGALVKAGTSSTSTDRNGVFILSDIHAYKNLGYISVQKDGYFNGSRSFVPTTGGNQVSIILLKKNNSGSVVGSQGGSITSSEGVILELAPNSIVKDNSLYTGQVNAAIKFINPESEHFQEEMPGNLVAVKDNQSKILTSYGMVAVELTDNSGALLQIASGQTAKLHFPIPASLLNSAPASIDLWSFDEVNGFWKYEGTANKMGSEYLATVSHFSFWNCDIPSKYIRIDGQVLSSINQQPISGAIVSIISQTYGSRGAFTNASGSFGGIIPANESLIIKVEVLCGGVYNTLYSSNIGPFTNNTILTPLNITLPNTTIITGSVVDCNGNPLNSGYAFANGQAYFMNNGTFSLATCGTTLSVQAMTSSPWVVGQSLSITLNGSNQNIGNLQACGSAPNNFSDIDGNSYPYIQIGTQTWSQTNLNVTRYRNGDPIPQVTDSATWERLATGAWCWFGNDSANYWIYGKLYNWYAVNDPRGLAPQGWHIPTNAEWKKMTKCIDPNADTSGNWFNIAGTAMKSASGWLNNGNGTNSSGFNGLPGGSRYPWGFFGIVGLSGSWWSVSENPLGAAWMFDLAYDESNLVNSTSNKRFGRSVRVVKD